jgi:hypothetical protein
MIVMTALLGPSVVHPANVDWLMRGDFSLHFLGWHLYRTGPWTLPLGATPLLIWPVGSSVGLTDSIPLASAFFKLFDAWLPPVFQFIGLWLVACVALQGVFGALLTRLATSRVELQVLGGLIFILSPPLIYRFGHAALTAHWLILAALYLSLRDGADVPSRRGALAWALLGAATAAIQPYILLMVVLLMLAAFARQVLASPSQLATIARHAALALAVSWLALWQSGSLMVPGEDGLTMGGFGAYSANLLTFVMPTEGRTLFSPGPVGYASPWQYEGYAYLGAGVLLLCAVVPIVTLWQRVMRAHPASMVPVAPRHRLRHVPMVVALAVLALMAFGPAITAGTQTLFTYDGRVWGPLLAFRTNGRMIWPLFYAVVTMPVLAAARFRGRTALVILATAALAQAIDVAAMSRFVGEVRTHGYRNPLNSRFWQAAAPHYRRLVLIPSNLCDRNGFVDYLPFALLAGQHGLAINAGATARYDTRRAAGYCQSLAAETASGLFDADTLYVIRPDMLAGLGIATRERSACGIVDGFGVCFARETRDRWRNAVDFDEIAATAP